MGHGQHVRPAAMPAVTPLVWCGLRTIAAPDDIGGLPPKAARRERAARLQRRRAAGRDLLSELLLAATGRPDWVVIAGANGKPVLAGDASGTAPAISISHSGSLVVAAVTRLGALGVDVERQDPRRDITGLARYAFGPREQAVVAAGGLPAFFRLWTLREAMGKATGRGVAMAADGIDRIGSHPLDGAWRAADDGWLLFHREPVAGYSLALAIRCNLPGIQWSVRSIAWL